MTPNMAGDPSPLHGQGWLNPWSVEEASGNRALLSYWHQADEWPWSYEARQEFLVEEAVLSDRPDLPQHVGRADAVRAWPASLFPVQRGTRIETSVTHVWTIDEQVLPVEKVPASGRYDLSDRLICGQDLDHGFGGWSGRVLG